MASTESVVLSNNQHEIVRQLADFPENIWADSISSFTLDKQVLNEILKKLNKNLIEERFARCFQGYDLCAKEIEMLKAEVMSMLLATSKTMMEKLNFINQIERLGILHHFEDEIENQLQQFFNLCTNLGEHQEYDLSAVGLQFRLFRQHGYNISCDIFDQFIDGNSKFQESLCSDMKGLLSLYEAAHVRTHGDKILDEALAFTTTHLKRGLSYVGSTLAKQVTHALEKPLHKGISRYEAYCYISIYEEDESNNKLLLRLAKLDYHLLQMLYKQDLCEIIRWGKKLDMRSKIPYARERFVECYFWAVGTFYEPKYSFARQMFAKIAVFVAIVDDAYDAYGTLEELKIFTDAVDRWDGNGIDQLPECLKTTYMTLLSLNKELEEILAKERRTYAFNKYIQEVWYHVLNLIDYVNISTVISWENYTRTSFTQSKWFLTNELPPFADYLSNSLITSTYYLLAAAAFLGMDSASEDFEKERGSGTAIECYMKDYNVSEEEAMKKFEEMCEDAWKVMNEECLRPTTIPREIFKVMLNLARICEVVYDQREDKFTCPSYLEGYVKAMFIDSISV
ncbi:viridiflorene synthase-like [Coffea eugenioides]|uniref:viridiflorene synthase-like n=1 Tax=Coffea eugenioides TaxID=49369 RepID=UPI000F611153|nr:viridiflorene synthase-like [Coffea eugenioides]